MTTDSSHADVTINGPVMGVSTRLGATRANQGFHAAGAL
jgi:hypothetical protein